jgi:sugar/nucleoside kinase (ribokinase family)
MAIDVLCIGHAAYDVSMFVDEFPAENSKRETQVLLQSGGGPAANAACLLSSWGSPCAFAGLVGDDDYGRRIRAEFEAAGTDISLLELRPGYDTPLSFILVNQKNASRTIVNRKAQKRSLEIPAAKLAALAPSILVFDGHELPAALAALEAFPNAISILDAGSWREGTAKLAELVDYLVTSEPFAMRASAVADLGSDEAQRDCVRELRDRFGAITIVTLGENGLIADDGSGFRHFPAYPAEAVDTTAAGDIFHGALVYAIASKIAFDESLRFAAMAASLSVRVAGGRGSIPTLDQVKEALRHAG